MMKTPRLLLLGLAAAGLYFGCQSTDSSPEPTGPQTITVPLKVPDTSRIPDSLVWRTKTEAGNRPVACSDLACPQAFVLKSALGATDTFHLELWQLGIREAGLRYLPAAGSNTLVQAGAAVADSTSVLALQLLASFRSYRLAHKDTLARPRPSDLVNYYALLLLDSAKVYAAGTVPTGMSRDSLQRALVLRAGRTGWTAAQLVARGLPGVTTESVRSVLAVLVQAKLVPDTTALFPPTSRPPVSDTTRPTIRRNAPANADTSVAWGVRSLRLSWTVTDDSSLAKVLLDDSLLAGAEGQYEKTVPLRVGGNTFVLQAFDARGNLRRDTVRVARRADSTKPVVSLVTPPRDTIVDNAVASFAVAIQASDAESGIDSVKIGTKVVKTAPFAATIDLAVGANIVVLQAWNGAGAASEAISVKIDRRAMGDTTRPTIRRVAPRSPDTAVVWGVKTMTFTWTVTDDSSLAKVLFDDSVLTGADGVYQKTVALAVGARTYTLTALDARGNRRNDTARVVRSADPDKPTVRIEKPSQDTVVSFGTESVAVVVKANDVASGVKSLTVNGLALDASGKANVPLAAGKLNSIVAVAVDSAGNQDSAVVKVTVAKDSTPPAVQIAKPSQDTSVPTGTTSISVSVVASDAESGLDHVEIQGVKLTSSPFTWTVDLVAGVNTIQVDVFDKAGNRNSATRKVVAKEAVAPPTFFPNGSSFASAQYVQLSCATAGATIQWSTDKSNWSEYTSSMVPISSSKTLYARSFKAGSDTTTASASYAILSNFPWNTNVLYGTLRDSRDGQSYKTVTIGTQIWMAENLNYRGVGRDSLGACSADSTCGKYGREYSWPEALGLSKDDTATLLNPNLTNEYSDTAPSPPRQGACPVGWHVSSYHEWNVLLESINENNSSCTSLESLTGWPDSVAGVKVVHPDTYGFRVLFGGSNYWFGSETASYMAWFRWFGSNGTCPIRYYGYKSQKMNVRCLKD